MASFDWFRVEAGHVSIGKRTFSVDTFEISFSPVTVEQFEEFLGATGHERMPDLFEGLPNHLIECYKANYAPRAKDPLFPVTHDDAVAFCDWAKLRLPSEAELKHFFQSACRKQRRFDHQGECWTSTTTGKDRYVTWDGPYEEGVIDNLDHMYRRLVHRHLQGSLEVPCFRVVKGTR